MTILRFTLASIAVLAIAGACTGPPLAQPRPGTTGSAPPPAAGTRVIDRSKVLRGFMLHEREGAEVVHKYDVADECFGRSQATASSQTGGGGNGDPVLRGPEARYVVVYFATRPDAEAFATALPVVRARVLPVTTRCIG